MILNFLEKIGKKLKNCKILLMGITFKENCPDIRNSKVALWRRETRSGTFLEPHTNVHNHSWVCKTDLELITSEEIFATGIANTGNGTY